MNTALVWFRNDLRVADNEALTTAIERHQWVLPVYIFDPSDYETTWIGLSKTGPHRARFLRESVQSLRKRMRALGGELVVRTGDTTSILEQLKREFSAQHVYCTAEYTREELEVEKKVAGLERFHSQLLFHPEDVPFVPEDTPEVFTAFRKKCEKYASIRSPLPPPDGIRTPEIQDPGEVPSLADLGLREPENDARAVLHFKGGENEALERLRHYFWETHRLATYKHTRNALIGADYSSKFSPWLANGSISARTIHAEVKRFEKEVKKNQDTYWLLFELAWRDFFKYVAMKHGDRLFHRKGILQSDHDMEINRPAFERWAAGQTSEPFVNANMRELNATGFMSNRGRQNVASFLTKDLRVDWRMGASYFESFLVDYDVCSNFGNWQYIAGVGNDPRTDRYFNIRTQADRYDPSGEYVRLWE